MLQFKYLALAFTTLLVTEAAFAKAKQYTKYNRKNNTYVETTCRRNKCSSWAYNGNTNTFTSMNCYKKKGCFPQ